MKAFRTASLAMGLPSLVLQSSLSLAGPEPADQGPAPAADAPAPSSSSSGSSSGSSGSSTHVSGYIRSETAINQGGEDPFNQYGNVYNGVPVTRTSPLGTDVATRDAPYERQGLDMQLFRGELDALTHFNDNWSFVAKARAVYDPGWYENFNPGSVGSQAVGTLYGTPNYFKYDVRGLQHPNPLEWAGDNYMVDFPSLFLEYNRGAFDMRIGNQQIAWGQALFFRVLDVPDGLDYRRHSLLDYAPEEFSDKRVPALAVRASYQFENAWLVDSYVQKFQPTVYSNPNTMYNQIPSQFTVVDNYRDYDTKIDLGLRTKGQVGDLGIQAIYAHRYNPDGVYRWTASGVDRDIPGLPGSGLLLEHTPFEVDPTGVWSANEWNYYAAQARLNGVGGLNAAINDFQPYTGKLGAGAVTTLAQEQAELNEFFQLAGGAALGKGGLGGLRGWIERDYKAEDDVGGGLSYTLPGAPGSFTDQLIVNWEVLYTPNKTFTSPDLGIDFLKTNEWSTDLVLEKYQRFSNSLPATYLVAQFMYKSKSDLFGRYIGGMGGGVDQPATGYSGGFKALAFALQQPFPNLIWRVDMSVLYDLQGGLLVQPAVRWKPNGNFSAELFYNYVNGHLGNPTKNIFGGIDYVSEATIRMTYQF